MLYVCTDPRHGTPCISENAPCAGCCADECDPGCQRISEGYIVKTRDPKTKRLAFIVDEEGGKMSLTEARAKATAYKTTLEATCALVYLPDGYKGEVVAK